MSLGDEIKALNMIFDRAGLEKPGALIDANKPYALPFNAYSNDDHGEFCIKCGHSGRDLHTKNYDEAHDQLICNCNNCGFVWREETCNGVFDRPPK